MIEIITDKDQWTSVLEQFDLYDSYHTYNYHCATKDSGEDPILLKYTEENKTIAIPLLIKNIEGTAYRDLTSAYGYVGPLSQNIGENFNNARFRNQLHDYLLESNVITVFSRLHPYIPSQESVLKEIGKISKIGNIVNIDLSKDLETQIGLYQKRLRTYINKSRKIYSVIRAQTKHEISQFIDLYYDNMCRVNAHPKYYFAKDYFFRLAESKDFKTEILLATCNDTHEIIAGAMFFKKNGIVQYHLAGSKEEYLHLNPIKLLIDEARIIATREKYTFLNLGGGIGSKEDSLFHFKSHYSKDYWAFAVWKHVVNAEVYENLVHEKFKTVPLEQQQDFLAYFPHYRCNI